MPSFLRLACALVLCALPARGLDADPGEYAVKAAFLYNFAKFVEWPAEGEASAASSPFVISILGDDPFDAAIDDTLRGKAVASRQLVLRRIRRAEEVGDSRILFISSSEKAQLAEILKHLEGTAVLTVGEMDRFAEQGGVIRFRMEEKRVRLDINPEAAERANLRISSELLKLARIVKGAP